MRTLICLLLLAIGNAHALTLCTKSWDLLVGGGALYKPEYFGSNDYETKILPYARMEYKNKFFIDPIRGIGYVPFKEESFKVTMLIRYDGGRDSGDNIHLNGLNDIPSSWQFRLALDYAAKNEFFGVKITQDITKSEKGLLFNPYVGYKTFIYPIKTVLSVSLGLNYASSKYMNTFYSISASESAASGLAVYDASSGIRDIHVRANIRKIFTTRWALNVIPSYYRLLSSSKSSPITTSSNQVNVAVLLAYKVF